MNWELERLRSTTPVKITLKMYASLAQFLPPQAVRNIVDIDVDADASIHDVLDRFHVPRQSAHLVLVNGVYIDPGRRDEPLFGDGDALAIWPPVAGG